MQEYRNRPFAILAVSLDADQADAQAAVAQDHVNWPSWWDPDHSMARAFHMPNFVPSIYVIDGHGRIRSVPSADGLDGPALRSLIEQLVRDAEHEKALSKT